MKSTWGIRIVTLAATAFGWAEYSLAQSVQFTYQGRLQESGNPVEGAVDVVVRLFDAPSGGTTLGQQGVGLTTVTDGLFGVVLNTGAEFGPEAFTSDQRWLEFELNGQVMSPRQRITRAPFAIAAETASNLAGPIRQGNGVGYKAENSQGVLEEFLYPRWTDDRTYMTIGSGGLQIRTPGPGYAPRLQVTDDGRLGIGTSSPNAGFRAQFSGGGSTWKGGLAAGDGQSSVVMGELFGRATVGAHNGALNGWSDLVLNCDANGFGGKVGIGIANPAHRLHVSGPTMIESPNGALFLKATQAAAGTGTWAMAIDGGTGSFYICTAPDNPVGGQISSAPFQVVRGAPTNSLIIHQTGRTQVRTLQITGGSDIAEPFDITCDGATERRSDEGKDVAESRSSIEPGMVVCIDPEQAGKLRLSQTAFDRTVAGVISGAAGINPGMVLTQEDSIADGKHPVALTGRVYCYVDADANGAIRPGDLLTTSGVAGHAMRAGNDERTHGAILGKAMSSLESGRGLVLILVSLQ